MKVWITKYSLTKGIFDIEVEEPERVTTMVSFYGSGSYPQYFHGEGRDWHRTKMGAVQRANDMREKKIASMQNSIKRLAKLDFAK